MMQYTYSPKYIAYVLFICLILQNCNNVATTPLVKEDKELPKQLDIQAILGKTFKTEENHCIRFYEVSHVLQASVQVLDKVYDGLPVNIEQGVNLAKLVSLGEKIQQKRMLIIFEEEKPTSVLIRKAWLLEEKEEDTNTEAIVFCGNPGVGKSTLCNSVFQEARFVSGRDKGTGITKAHQQHMYANRLYIDTPGLEDVAMRQQAAAEIKEALKKDKHYKIVFIVTLESGRVRMGDLTAINLVCDAIKTHFEYGLIVNKCSEEVIDDIIQEGGLGRYLTTLHKQPVRTIMLTRDRSMDDKPNIYFKAHDENRRKLLDLINTLPASNIQEKDINKIDVSNFEQKIQEMEKRYAKAMAEQKARHKQEREEQEARMKKERVAHEANVRKIEEQMQESQQAAEAKIEEERKKTENEISEIREEYEKKQHILEAQRQKEKEKQQARIKSLEGKMEEEKRVAEERSKKERAARAANIKKIQQEAEERQRVAEEQRKKRRKEQEEKEAKWYIKTAKQEDKEAPMILRSLALKGNQVGQAWIMEKGDKEVQYILGQMYERGTGVDKDKEKAAKWYIQAAQQGQCNASAALSELALKESRFAQEWIVEQGSNRDQYALGQIYEHGTGVAKDEEKSAEWYIQAARHGHKEAPIVLKALALKGNKVARQWAIGQAEQTKELQYILAQMHELQMYEQRAAILSDYQEAVKWYRKVAEQGNTEAVKWVKRVADRGDAAAQYNLGYIYKNGSDMTQDYGNAVAYFKKAADQGHAAAQYNLGLMYKNGEGITQNYQEALKWFQKAAKQGHPEAQYSLGYTYDACKQANNNYQDITAMLKCYQKAVNQADAAAQYTLGSVYKSGPEAVRWYQQAAVQGHAGAQNNLGIIYRNGWGVEQDYGKAARYFEQAAQRGHAEAQYNLGIMYDHGWGVTKSETIALKWYERAANQKYVDAQITLLYINNNKYYDTNSGILTYY